MLVTLVNVTAPLPTAAGSMVTAAIEVFGLVTVRVTGLGGAACKKMLMLTWRLRPTATFDCTLMPGAVTVTGIGVNWLGVLNPAGCAPILRVAVAAVDGWKEAFWKLSPPLKVSVDGVRVPGVPPVNAREMLKGPMP